MDSKLMILVSILILSLWVSTCRCDDDDGNEYPDTLPCLERLLPCQAYMRSAKPPLECCDPLKEMLVVDPGCLCSIFDNAAVLTSLNITQDEALELPKKCGGHSILSLCNKKENPSPSPVALPISASLISSGGLPKRSAGPRKCFASVVVMLVVSGMYIFILAF